jgi:hypothetical protein
MKHLKKASPAGSLLFNFIYIRVYFCHVFCFSGDIYPGIHIGNIDGKTDEEGVFWTVESCRI